MLVFTARYGKKIEYACATVHVATLSIFDNESRGGGRRHLRTCSSRLVPSW
jgi:hypothetical protein